LTKLADELKVTVAGGDLSKSSRVLADVMCCGSTPTGAALLRSGAKPGDAIYVTGTLGKPWTLPPIPRIAEGIALRGIAHSAIDISDGISLDLQRLCAASRVSAELDSASIPVYSGASLERALHGGEDYELLFTAPPSARLKHRRIGTIKGSRPGRVYLDGKLLRPLGFDHFRGGRS
jgi:thiamine-monophosphate kinase